jgi:hypothetical protein
MTTAAVSLVKRMCTCIGIGETGSPSECTTTGFNGVAGGDHIVNEVDGQEFNGADRSDYRMLLDCETGLTALPQESG